MEESAVATGAGAGGLVIEASKQRGKLQASADLVRDTIAGGERVWYFTLNWIAAHPFMTVVLCLAVAWWRWQAHLTKVKVAGMKSDYKSARERAQIKPRSGRTK